MLEEPPSQLEASGFTLVTEEGMENGTQALKYTAHISWTQCPFDVPRVLGTLLLLLPLLPFLNPFLSLEFISLCPS